MHFLFIILHLVSIFFISGMLLFITIPTHIIYTAIAKPKPTGRTHVRCPDCREVIRKDASVCKHCTCPLVPQ